MTNGDEPVGGQKKFPACRTVVGARKMTLTCEAMHVKGRVTRLSQQACGGVREWN